MKHDEAWDAWLTSRREHPSPAGLTDRILERVEQERLEPHVALKKLPSSTLAQRLAPYLLWSAAIVVCAARIYGSVGLLVPGFAFASPDEPVRGISHVELAASGL